MEIESSLKDVARTVRSKVDRGEMTAAQVSVAKDGDVMLQESFGHYSREKNAPIVTNESPFLIASITKPLTATAVMICADQGLIDIDDFVVEYLPEFAEGDRKTITVRNLLTHTSGLPDMLPENEELRRRNAHLNEFVSRTLTTPLIFEPGTKVSYQSMGFALAGEIIERVTNIRLREFIQQNITEPLEMEHTFLGMGRYSLDELVACDVEEKSGDSDYKRWDWNSEYWRDLGAPWGGLHSTAGDLTTFLETFLNEGEHDGTRILNDVTAREMISNQTKELNSPWGLGWGCKDSLDWTYFGEKVSHQTFGHSGATGTIAWADPVRKMSFVCLTTKPLEEHEPGFFDDLSKTVVETVDE